MPEVESHIRNAKHILLTWFILFSLSPCVVKDVLFNSVNIEYTKPLNKSKIAAQVDSCQYSSNNNTRTSVAKQSKINKQIESVGFSAKKYFMTGSAKVRGNYSKIFSGNSPPKYILFKRLKLDVG